MAAERERIRILVVEDNLAEYMPLQKALKQKFPSDVVILQADTMAEGLQFAMEGHCHAALISYKVHGGTAKDLIEGLKARAKAAGRADLVFFLFFDAASTETNYAQLLRQFPDITLIEKPYLNEEVAKLVREAVMPAHGGDMGHYSLGLYDLIQAYVLSRQSVTLRVMDEIAGMGTIAIRNGHLVHAAFGGVHGLQALAEIATMRNARIRLERGCHTAMESITLLPQEALCEASRIIEEQRRKLLGRDRDNSSGSVRKVRVMARSQGKGVFDPVPAKGAPADSEVAKRETVADLAGEDTEEQPYARHEDTIIVEPADTQVGERRGVVDGAGGG